MITSSLEEFLIEANKKFPNKFDYSKVNFINHRTKVCIVCKMHGEFYNTPYVFLKLITGCRECGRNSAINKIKYSKEYFIDLANKNHNFKYDYSLVIIKNLQSKIIIICPIHGQFEQHAGIHLRSGCKLCSHEKLKNTIIDLINRFNIIHNFEYNYSNFSNYKNNKQKIDIICKIHGNFNLTVNAHLRNIGCPKCSRNIFQSNYFNDFIEKSNSIHDNFYDYSNINHIKFKTDNKVDIFCPIHGLFNQLAWQHKNGSKCPKCVRFNRKLNITEFLVRAYKAHGDRYDYSKVNLKLVSDKIEIICSKHGSFLQRPSSHLYIPSGCPKCSKVISKKETKWLDYIGLPLNCRNKMLMINDKMLFPDGFDPATNTIYEFYGDFWHGNLNIYAPNYFNKISKMTIQELYDRTIKREELLKNAGYNIISIWENDWNKLKIK